MHTQKKIAICEKRYLQQQGVSALSSVAQSPVLPSDTPPAAGTALQDLISGNDAQLSACKRVVLALRATKAAQFQLQKCLDEEQTLLQKLQGPMQACVINTKQLISKTCEQLSSSNPKREQRHAEMLMRYIESCCCAERRIADMQLLPNSSSADMLVVLPSCTLLGDLNNG